MLNSDGCQVLNKDIRRELAQYDKEYEAYKESQELYGLPVDPPVTRSGLFYQRDPQVSRKHYTSKTF